MKSEYPRIICILRILEKYTDIYHQLTTNEILKLLESDYQIKAHRITLKSDMEELIKMGYDIVETRSSQNLYFLGSRTFEFPEVKLLIDAVESSKFITPSKTTALVSKISLFVSKYQQDKIKRTNYVTNCTKQTNEQIYYIVDTINDAIDQHKQISFQYYDYTKDKNQILKNDGEVYILSPYNLLWNGDNYYVIGYSEKHKGIISFRVDRIAFTPEILNIDAIKKPLTFDLDYYKKNVFFMYKGKPQIVQLRCKDELMRTMIDRFGVNVVTKKYDDHSFLITAEVEVSQTFYGWVFGFNGDVQIIAPSSVKKEYIEMIQKAYRKIR